MGSYSFSDGPGGVLVSNQSLYGNRIFCTFSQRGLMQSKVGGIFFQNGLKSIYAHMMLLCLRNIVVATGVLLSQNVGLGSGGRRGQAEFRGHRVPRIDEDRPLWPVCQTALKLLLPYIKARRRRIQDHVDRYGQLCEGLKLP